MTQLEIERQERQIAALNRLAEALEVFNGLNGPPARLTEALHRIEAPIDGLRTALTTPSPGWRRMLDEFRQAAMRIPTTIRARF